MPSLTCLQKEREHHLRLTWSLPRNRAQMETTRAKQAVDVLFDLIGKLRPSWESCLLASRVRASIACHVASSTSTGVAQRQIPLLAERSRVV